jgi:hypothetical protein
VSALSLATLDRSTSYCSRTVALPVSRWPTHTRKAGVHSGVPSFALTHPVQAGSIQTNALTLTEKWLMSLIPEQQPQEGFRSCFGWYRVQTRLCPDQIYRRLCMTPTARVTRHLQYTGSN